MASKSTETILIISDVHVPDHDRKAWKAMLAVARDIRPTTVVIAGDFLELQSVSQHSSFNRELLEEDLAAGRQALETLQGAAPQAKVIYLEGNHETRLTRFIEAKVPSLSGTLNLATELKLKERGILWLPENKQPWSRGKLDVIHGHQMSSGGGPRHHATKMCEMYGESGRVVVYGHTHKPQMHTSPARAGVKTAVGLGCLRTLNPGWLHGANGGWSHCFGIAEIAPSGRVAVYQVPVTDGYINWSGKTYDGRCR